VNFSKIKRDISNLPGWRTNRKIVVIETDDWGSTYMPSIDAYKSLSAKGLKLNTHYLQFDNFETNDDLLQLFEVLSKHKDATGRPPVLTGVNVVANPNFEKIKANGFQRYEYELWTDTAKRFKASDRVQEIWQKGIKERLIVPIFHGREHLNVQRWMKLLKQGNKSILDCFEHGVATISEGYGGEHFPDLRAAFDLDSVNELITQKEILIAGLNSFEHTFGFRSSYFVPTNGPFNSSLESTLAQEGVKFIGTGKVHSSPLGGGKFKKSFKYIGKKNKFNQCYLTRNCFFEPSSTQHSRDKDWIDSCMSEIHSAFKLNKPATISSHRVNYMGGIVASNREDGLRKLDQLLVKIIQNWPGVEFMTSEELGALILKTQKK
jgi:hypothetical protein